MVFVFVAAVDAFVGVTVVRRCFFPRAACIVFVHALMSKIVYVLPADTKNGLQFGFKQLQAYHQLLTFVLCLNIHVNEATA